MQQKYDELIRHIYRQFNARDIDSILIQMDKNVHWPNGWEGGYVDGHIALRDYWTRQWREIDPFVEQVKITIKQDGIVEVEVYQLVKDKAGNKIFEGKV